MQTSFIIPKIIQQKSDDFIHTIPWDNLSAVASADLYACSIAPLYTISGLWMERFRSSTNQIWATNFNIPTLSNISGIELQVNVLRGARIEDLVIQLTLHDELIGINKADIKTSQEAYWTNTKQAGDYHIYGGSDDLWGTTLTASDIMDPSFGAVISYQSNETLPHRDLVYVNQVGMRIHTL